jgi:hypothetical protein
MLIAVTDFMIDRDKNFLPGDIGLFGARVGCYILNSPKDNF